MHILASKKTSSSALKVKAAIAKSPANALPKALKLSEVFNECPISAVKIPSGKDLGEYNDFIAQGRAVRAINMGLGIRKPGYNIYVAGHIGTGKTSVIRSFLEKWSKKSPPPPDWIYVHNFDKPEQPTAIQLPAGEARKFKKKMENFVRDLRHEIRAAFQSEDYENAINTYMSAANERKTKLFSELEKLAKSMDFNVKSSRVGIETVPLIDGRVISEADYATIDDKQREEIEGRRAKLEPDVLDFARKVRSIEAETREYIDTLRGEIGLYVVGAVIDPLGHDYSEKDFQEVTEYIVQMKHHILENLTDFVEIEEEGEEGQEAQPSDERDPLKKYQVNIFVDNSTTKGAPVIIESNPTYYNLFGKVEKNVEYGVYHTDFSMIQNGAIHRANGGYLVINATDIFRTPTIWETLKRVLRNRRAFIEDMGEQLSMLATSGLRPQEIPLDLKVILIGNDEVYHILFEEDEEFNKIFKIKADFDYKMTRSAKNIQHYVSFVASRTMKEDLLPFDRSAIATIVEYGSRMVEDQNELSTQFGTLKDLTIEADFIAREGASKVVKRQHVEQALDEKYYRLNMIEEHIYEALKNEDILISVTGQKIGQINALTVYDMGDYSFGKTCRITCTTSLSDDGILNIERASRLSGRSHDKGMHIISSYLDSVLTREHYLGISASVCFEQSYSMIDGDSASAAELIAIISAMAELPVDQSFAITGSINQMGEIQPIGGLNEKAEGFYKICKLVAKGNKNFNLIIPYQNVRNLMLHSELREAVKAEQLKIYPVKYLWEAFEILTGVALGLKDIHDKTIVPGSAFDIINKKLSKINLKEEKAHHRKDRQQVEQRKLKRVAKPVTKKKKSKRKGNGKNKKRRK